MQHPMIAALVSAFANIADKFKPINYPKAGAPRGRYNQPTPGTKQSGKTRRGAIHKVNPTFKSRLLLQIETKFGSKTKVTPAMYRRLHLGKSKVTPNYMKPHRAPRARNVVIGAVNES